MAAHDLAAMRVGVVLRGFAIGTVTYPRGTIAMRIGDGHELFLQLPLEHTPAPVVPKAKIEATWEVIEEGAVDRHRGTVATEDDDMRVDVIIATRSPGISRARAQRLIEDGRVSAGGHPVKRSNQRLHAGEVIEVVVDRP